MSCNQLVLRYKCCVSSPARVYSLCVCVYTLCVSVYSLCIKPCPLPCSGKQENNVKHDRLIALASNMCFVSLYLYTGNASNRYYIATSVDTSSNYYLVWYF